jgi:hypothetical protein
MVFTLKNSDDSLLSILKPRKANKAFEDEGSREKFVPSVSESFAI